MSAFLQKSFLGFIVLLITVCSYGQEKLSMTISPSRINRNEYTNLKIIIENSSQVQQVTPPSLNQFMVISGPNQENGMSSVNGSVSRYTVISFILKPKRAGKFSIEPATIQVGGRKLTTNAVTLMVNNAISPGNQAQQMPGSLFPTPALEPAGPTNEFSDFILRKGDNMAEKVSKNMMLKLQVDKSSCFAGEPVVATYKLYTRLKSDSKLTGNPSFNGFSVIDLTNHEATDYTREKINGREYNVYTIRKAQLYPLQPGEAELEPAELENNIQFLKEEYAGNDLSGFFEDFPLQTLPADAVINQTVSLSSNKATVTVKPLPEQGKPEGFSGAVGNFTMNVALLKSSFPVNETGKLQVMVTGSGNLQLLTAPVLKWPEGIDAFEPETGESLNKTMVPVYGRKLFEYGFSADKPGTYILPAVDFSYFDPATASYKTISTKQLIVTVTNAIAGISIPVTINNTNPVTGVNKIFKNRWWIILLLACIVVPGLIFWLRKEKKQVAADTIPDLNEKPLEEPANIPVISPLNPLSETEACMDDEHCSMFYRLLNNELKQFFASRFHVNTESVNSRQIASILDSYHISNETALAVQQLLQKIEWKTYTPFERDEDLRIIYNEALQLIHLVNTYSIRHR